LPDAIPKILDFEDSAVLQVTENNLLKEAEPCTIIAQQMQS